MNATEKKPKTPSQITVKGKTWTPQVVREELEKNDVAVKKALLRIYSFQTEDEKVLQNTYQTNGKGFNGIDAEILSSFAEQLETKGWLSPKQISLARKKLLKYSRQLFLYIVETRQETYRKYGL